MIKHLINYISKVEWSTHWSILLAGYLVFVAHTHISKADGSVKEKGCVILDIRGLNAQAKPDLYQLPSQEELIGMARWCPLISVIDATSFFYQWRTKSEQ